MTAISAGLGGLDAASSRLRPDVAPSTPALRGHAEPCFRCSVVVPDAHAGWPRGWARSLARRRTAASTDITAGRRRSTCAHTPAPRRRLVRPEIATLPGGQPAGHQHRHQRGDGKAPEALAKCRGPEPHGPHDLKRGRGEDGQVCLVGPRPSARGEHLTGVHRGERRDHVGHAHADQQPAGDAQGSVATGRGHHAGPEGEREHIAGDEKR
jgi:hypothetical protein